MGEFKLGTIKWQGLKVEASYKLFQKLEVKTTTYKLWKWEYQVLVDCEGNVVDSRTIWSEATGTKPKIERRRRFKTKKEIWAKIGRVSILISRQESSWSTWR